MVSHPSKAKGYVGEVNAREALRAIGFTKIDRTGSLNYSLNAPDLIQYGPIKQGWKSSPIRIVTTQDDRGPVLITMSAADLGDVLAAYKNSPDLSHLATVAQCKKRKTSYIGRLWKELREATS